MLLLNQGLGKVRPAKTICPARGVAGKKYIFLLLFFEKMAQRDKKILNGRWTKKIANPCFNP
jgi:hypothetical protein